MSSEQAEGEPLDGRSDLYALGLVGVYALTGTVVAEGEDAREVLAVAPGWLRDAVSRCLEPSPDDRFADAAMLGEAIAPQRVAAPEMPAALRVWLTRTQPLVVAASLWTLFTGVGAVVMFFRWTAGIAGAPGDLGRQLILMVGPWVVLGIARVFETRRALAAGYELADFRAAALTEAARKREEFAYEAAATGMAGRVARGVAIAAVLALLAFALLEGTGVISLSGHLTNRIAIGLALLAAGSGVVGIVSPGRWGKRDLPTDLGARFWRSKFGAWVVKLAGWGLGRRARAADAMHRATEVLLADELEDLYHGLPAEVRRGLTEVPGTIKRLTASAESLRAQVEAARALGQAADLEQGRMMEAVAALETLRVGLLKLRAGTVSIEGFTTDLDAVQDVGERVDRLLDARREVDLGLPRRSTT